VDNPVLWVPSSPSRLEASLFTYFNRNLAIYTVLRKAWLIQVGAVLLGLGGGFSVSLAGQNALIADTSVPAVRSYYMGLSLIMWWTGNAIGPLASAPLVSKDMYSTTFGITAATWVFYFFYLQFFLRETRVPLAERPTSRSQDEASSVGNTESEAASRMQRVLAMLRSVVEPLQIMVAHPTVFFVALALAGTVFSIGAFEFLVPYCDSRFGLAPSEVCILSHLQYAIISLCKQAGIVAAVQSISRAITVLCILPVFIAIYQWLSNPKEPSTTTTAAASADPAEETTPLLSEAAIEAQVPQEGSPVNLKKQEVSVRQELVISRIGLLFDAIGMIMIWLSQNTLEVSLCTNLIEQFLPHIY
jgi:hypothetical protein